MIAKQKLMAADAKQRPTKEKKNDVNANNSELLIGSDSSHRLHDNSTSNGAKTVNDYTTWMDMYNHQMTRRQNSCKNCFFAKACIHSSY